MGRLEQVSVVWILFRGQLAFSFVTSSPWEQQQSPPAKGQPNGDDDGLLGGLKDILFGTTGPRGGKRDGIVQTAAKSAVRQVTNQIVRGMLGSLLGGRKR